jgi:hypothetical protein
LAPRLDLFSRFSSWLNHFEDRFPAATLTRSHLNRFCLDRTAYNRSAKVHQNALGRVRCGGYPFGPCKVFGKSAIMRPLRSITRPALALGCRAGKSQMIMALGRVGGVVCVYAREKVPQMAICRSMRSRQHRSQHLFQICSSTAFGLASPLVSLKPSRLNHCRERKTNPRPSLSRCVA